MYVVVMLNPDQSHEFGPYYLDFATRYKFSYAASFGKANANLSTNSKVKKWISDLCEISCREKSSAQIARSLTGRAVTVVNDPVLLLKRDEWETIAGDPIEGKYIFSYSTHSFPIYEAFLSMLSKQTGLPVKKMVYTPKPSVAIKQGILIPQSPRQWLQLIEGAEYVVTNSFHATAFSVLFHKNFFTVVAGEKGAGINMRMNDFLGSIGLEERIINMLPESISTETINYNHADSILEKSRDQSIEFLVNNLERALEKKKKENNN